MSVIHCPHCGNAHDLFETQVGFGKPDAWFAVPPDERPARCRAGDDLAEVDGEAFFLRGVLEIPVTGEPTPFGWGIWARVAEGDFRRYAAAFERTDQGSAAPFAGTIATQLSGYPQTVGVPVRVQPSDGRSRPLLTVTDAAHPLGEEQRWGIDAARVLELLSPWLHPDAPRRAAAPYAASLDRDGWVLLDAEQAEHEWDTLNWLPSPAQRHALQVDEHAKLLFRIAASDAHGAPATHVERMWVRVTERAVRAGGGVAYRGVLTNRPHVAGLVREGMEVWWEPRHVVDVVDREERQASAADDLLRCGHHGPSRPTFVCQHLPRGERLGFHQAADGEGPRPDAWCDACNAAYEAEGEWNDRSEAVARVTMLCVACYDAAAARNRRA